MATYSQLIFQKRRNVLCISVPYVFNNFSFNLAIVVCDFVSVLTTRDLDHFQTTGYTSIYTTIVCQITCWLLPHEYAKN